MILRNLILPILLLVSLPTQVQASKLTEDQLTKKIFAQDEIAKIENRLHELKRQKIKDEDDDDVIGGAGGGGDDVAPRPPRPPTDKVEDLTRRLNIYAVINLEHYTFLDQILNQMMILICKIF